VLDRAEALRAKRRAALAELDTLTQVIFLDIFGDPASNPKGWPSVRLEQTLVIPLRNGLSPSNTGKISGKVLTLSAITGSGFDETAYKISTFKRLRRETKQ
jgi:type I restriction enzyme S subunit